MNPFFIKSSSFFVVGKTYFKLWGDSQAIPGRYLPQLLTQNLKTFQVEVDGKKGGGLYQREIDCILRDAKSKYPSDQIHVMMIGGNNLRNGHESVESFEEKCQQLCEAFENIDNAKFVMIGMIPSSKAISKPIFKMADRQLEKLAEKYSSKISFLNIRKLFIANDKINPKLYDDSIHLSHEGMKILSNAISHHVLCKFLICVMKFVQLDEMSKNFN